MRLFTFSNLLIFLFLILPSYTFSQVNIEKFRKAEDKQDFTGSFELDVLSKIGNVDVSKINFENHCAYRWKTMNTFLIIRGDYGWKGGEQYSNEALAHLRNVFGLRANVQLEIFTQIDYNKKRLLLFRGLIGGGLRFNIYKSIKTNLWWGTAFMLEYERLSINESDSEGSKTNVIRWSNYLAMNKSLNEQVHLVWTTYLQPRINEFKDIRILSETDLIIRLGKHFSLAISFRMRYDSQPPHGIKLLDTAIKTGLVLNY